MHSLSTHIGRVLSAHGIDTTKRVIVAVSGGADSMALLHSLQACAYPCVVAHVNYGLRGEESDGDEKCVREFCAEHSILVEVMRVQEEDWKQYTGSTQESARNIRYAWFNDLLSKHGASAILTAHHANDQVETMLYQFVRGGAGKSVYGMQERSGHLIRPMLGISKSEVLQYAKENALAWREDSSNKTLDYTRNQIRNAWLPLVEQLNPAIYSTIQQRSSWMHQEQKAVESSVGYFLDKNIQREGSIEVLSIDMLRACGYGDIVLWKWLSARGFSSAQTIQISEKLKNEPSTEPAWFYSTTHQVCIQGPSIACSESVEHEVEIIHTLPWSNTHMSIDYCAVSDIDFTRDEKRQYLDSAQLVFPLVIRSRRDGDRFHPLGAAGYQKVSDFMVHAKIAAWKKEEVLLLQSKEEIAAVLQYRISEKFKKTETTEQCVRIQFF